MLTRSPTRDKRARLWFCVIRGCVTTGHVKRRNLSPVYGEIQLRMERGKIVNELRSTRPREEASSLLDCEVAAATWTRKHRVCEKRAQMMLSSSVMKNVPVAYLPRDIIVSDLPLTLYPEFLLSCCLSPSFVVRILNGGRGNEEGAVSQRV